MKIATYNLNNLFERPKVFELDGLSAEAALILKDYYRLINLLCKDSYKQDEAEIKRIIKNRIETTVKKKYFEIIQVREKLYSIAAGKIKLKAGGKQDWLGWVQLVKQEVHEVATQNTARIVDALEADILCTIEVESRTAMENFNKNMLANKYKYSMLIDGNDDRGIDVGLYSNYPITNIETHIFDTYTGANKRQYKIFSRDCAMYTIDYNGSPIHILCNHFKSQGYGSPVANDKKRQLQAERVQEIINQKFNLTKDNVVVAGDLNDTPDSKSLKPLLSMQGLENIIARNEGTHGTYLNTKKQFDYLLVSKALSDKYTDSRIERGGIFNGKNTIESPLHQASDHAAVVAEFKF